VKGHGLNFYFSGDTGYSPHLQEIASRLGPPDLAALPIGAYEPRWFMRTQHVDPPEAVQLHRELKVRHSLAIHWGTFELADDSLDAPVVALQQALRQSDLHEQDFWVIRQGDSRLLHR
jgi:L-ascorbate metabolism protein UlaG (beta-lactamase superfamily)